jgi:hypothetical protein
MHSNRSCAISVFLLLAACSAQPALLNSERIEQHFGSYGVEVLEQSGSVRRSNLYSLEGGGRICRTYAVVQFQDIPADIAATQEQVLAGQSIGASFKTAGWSVAKRTVYIGNVFVDTDDNGILQLMQLSRPQHLAMHDYRLDLHKSGREIHYATIVEVHHPGYLDVDALRRIYGVPAAGSPGPSKVAGYEALVHSE